MRASRPRRGKSRPDGPRFADFHSPRRDRVPGTRPPQFREVDARRLRARMAAVVDRLQKCDDGPATLATVPREQLESLAAILLAVVGVSIFDKSAIPSETSRRTAGLSESTKKNAANRGNRSVSKGFRLRGPSRIRTGGDGFANRCLTTWLRGLIVRSFLSFRAVRVNRTRRCVATSRCLIQCNWPSPLNSRTVLGIACFAAGRVCGRRGNARRRDLRLRCKRGRCNRCR